MRIDLHTHTSVSDGELTPQILIEQAIESGVDVLAITDHDTVGAFEQLKHGSNEITLITGTELSSHWQKTGVHIVGLNIDLHSETLQTGLARQQNARNIRAEKIARRLSKIGFANTLAGARQYSGDTSIGRVHFAQHLVNSGAVKDFKTAFKKYLGAGKAGDVKSEWLGMSEVIDWITQANGHAVLAHPAKYKLTNRKLEQLVQDFAAAGGHAIEVVSGKQDAQLTSRLARLATRHSLLASTGSDFHRPGQNWAALGTQPALPADSEPVWNNWGL
jgi:predicted metal-dependent phosphoesterase TrpH